MLTFLRRATRVHLEDVPLDAVRDALRQTIRDNGRRIDDAALDAATAATSGYPFMIQLVGYHVWRKTVGDHVDDVAVAVAVAVGTAAAKKRLWALVHETTLKDLSEVDRTYLLAIAQDEWPRAARGAES